MGLRRKTSRSSGEQWKLFCRKTSRQFEDSLKLFVLFCFQKSVQVICGLCRAVLWQGVVCWPISFLFFSLTFTRSEICWDVYISSYCKSQLSERISMTIWRFVWSTAWMLNIHNAVCFKAEEEERDNTKLQLNVIRENSIHHILSLLFQSLCVA